MWWQNKPIKKQENALRLRQIKLRHNPGHNLKLTQLSEDKSNKLKICSAKLIL